MSTTETQHAARPGWQRNTGPLPATDARINRIRQAVDEVRSAAPRVQPDKVDTTLLCRHELKYRIPETKARAIAQYIQAYIPPDRYALGRPGYEYPISSLYFDSENLRLCNETLQCRKNRVKLRVRCYDDLDETPCFFEIKRRLNNVVLKDRARLPKSAFDNAIRKNAFIELSTPKEQNALNQFLFYHHSLGARPIVLVRYIRQAFEAGECNRVRITFDRHLEFKTANQHIVTTNGPGWRPVRMDFVILEIKFTSCYPRWLSDLVKSFNLKQTAMSKYASSVIQSCELGLLSRPI